MPLIHGEHDPHLYCPPVVQVPAPLTRERAQAILAASAGAPDLLDLIASALSAAAMETRDLGPLPDHHWQDRAREVVAKIGAGA